MHIAVNHSVLFGNVSGEGYIDCNIECERKVLVSVYLRNTRSHIGTFTQTKDVTTTLHNVKVFMCRYVRI